MCCKLTDYEVKKKKQTIFNFLKTKITIRQTLRKLNSLNIEEFLMIFKHRLKYLRYLTL